MKWICGLGSNHGDALTLDNARRLEYGRTRRPDLRAARANRVFCTDEKRIRTENTVMFNTKQGVGFLYKIADCVRMCFSSVRNR
jgi:hypothetical protein